jgi:hypothetical protein
MMNYYSSTQRNESYVRGTYADNCLLCDTVRQVEGAMVVRVHPQHHTKSQRMHWPTVLTQWTG